MLVCGPQYISQLNVKLEEDNRALLMQVQALLQQNQDLLTQSLESKDQYAEEQKANMYDSLTYTLTNHFSFYTKQEKWAVPQVQPCML